jgi:predicted dehydrogenase
LKVTQILADLGTVVPGRRVDDDCQILLRFDNGARGALLASQISVGERNGLTPHLWREGRPALASGISQPALDLSR